MKAPGRKYRRVKPQGEIYPNLLQLVTPTYEGCVWAADFTHINHHGTDVSVATVIDLFTRRIVGVAVSTRHGAKLIIGAFGAALPACRCRATPKRVGLRQQPAPRLPENRESEHGATSRVHLKADPSRRPQCGPVTDGNLPCGFRGRRVS